MAQTLSDWAQSFIREERVGVVGTQGKDGGPHLTTMWYLPEEDGTIVINTIGRNQKVKNLRRDPRIALCIGDAGRSVTLYGTATISEDQATVRQDIERLVARYVKDEAARPYLVSVFTQQSRVSLRFKPERGTEFSTEGM